MPRTFSVPIESLHVFGEILQRRGAGAETKPSPGALLGQPFGEVDDGDGGPAAFANRSRRTGAGAAPPFAPD